MPEYSYWVIAGILLVIAEFMVSGLVVIFFGLAALLVGGLKFIGVLDDTVWELTIFSIASVLLLVLVRRFFKDKLLGNADVASQIDEDSAGLIGQRAVVAKSFANGVGEVILRGARWQAQGDEDFPEGMHVKVVKHDGLWLTVTPL